MKSSFKISLRFGLGCAFFMIAIMLTTYWVSGPEKVERSALYLIWVSNFVVLALSVIGSIYLARREVYGDNFPLGTAFRTGMLTTIFPALIYTIFSICFYLWIAPELKEALFRDMERGMIEEGLPQGDIESNLSMMKQYFFVMMGFGMALLYGLAGGFISLFAAIAMRRDG